jgi:DUF1365 family protein
MTRAIEHLQAQTCHTRKGRVRNVFRYGVDYVVVDPEGWHGPRLLGRDRRGVVSLWARDNGGAPGAGQGAIWARQAFGRHDIDPHRLELVTQPRVLGHVFNPVSFWLAYDEAGALIAVIAEVTNTYGERHSYLCAHADGREIMPQDRLLAQKLLHVSPFQPVQGQYEFRFDISAARIAIWIDYRHDDAGGGGVVATLIGPRRGLDNRAIVRMLLRRPFGARRVLALIHWQALRLWLRGARFRKKPAPPQHEVSR